MSSILYEYWDSNLYVCSVSVAVLIQGHLACTAVHFLYIHNVLEESAEYMPTLKMV